MNFAVKTIRDTEIHASSINRHVTVENCEHTQIYTLIWSKLLLNTRNHFVTEDRGLAFQLYPSFWNWRLMIRFEFSIYGIAWALCQPASHTKLKHFNIHRLIFKQLFKQDPTNVQYVLFIFFFFKTVCI